MTKYDNDDRYQVDISDGQCAYELVRIIIETKTSFKIK